MRRTEPNEYAGSAGESYVRLKHSSRQILDFHLRPFPCECAWETAIFNAILYTSGVMSRTASYGLAAVFQFAAAAGERLLARYFRQFRQLRSHGTGCAVFDGFRAGYFDWHIVILTLKWNHSRATRIRLFARQSVEI